MTKFKVGDKVVRLAGGCTKWFIGRLGHKAYYIVTGVSEHGYWIQVDGVAYGTAMYPWRAENFELYEEPEEELPPAPKSVYYPDMFTLMTGHQAVGGTAGITVRQSPYQDYVVSISVAGSKWSRLDADAALQLAHDLNRMANEIKRKERASMGVQ